MVIEQDIEHRYDYPWETIVLHYHEKLRFLPTVEAPDVVAVEFQNMRLESGVVKYTRLSTININAPKWMKKLAGLNEMQFETHVELDRSAKRMLCRTENLTFRNTFQMNELCIYSVDPEYPGEKTIFMTKASLRMEYILGISSPLEKVIMRNYTTSTKHARECEKKFVHSIHDETHSKEVKLTYLEYDLVKTLVPMDVKKNDHSSDQQNDKKPPPDGPRELKIRFKTKSSICAWTGKDIAGNLCVSFWMCKILISTEFQSREFILDGVKKTLQMAELNPRDTVSIFLNFSSFTLKNIHMSLFLEAIEAVGAILSNKVQSVYLYNMNGYAYALWTAVSNSLIQYNLEKCHFIQKEDVQLQEKFFDSKEFKGLTKRIRTSTTMDFTKYDHDLGSLTDKSLNRLLKTFQEGQKSLVL